MLHTDLSGRRIVVGAAVHLAPVLVVDRTAKRLDDFAACENLPEQSSAATLS